MKLVDLVITHGDSVVRRIQFKTGLNLILDKPTPKLTQSGNSVGKTTVLRLIDYCLGSDGDDIWQDAEFKNNINQDVYKFLHGRTPVLIKIKTEDPIRGVHELCRSFATAEAGKPTLRVDTTDYTQAKAYKNAVKQLLFGYGGEKPTLRQLVPKFVRSSPALMSRTLKFLGEYASSADYEALHLFLFGFFAVGVLEERLSLTNTKRKLDRDWEALNRLRNEGEIEQLIFHLRREIEAIGLSPQLRGEVPAIASRANAVSAIRSEAANVVGRLSRYNAEIASLGSTIAELGTEVSEVDRRAIEAVYREAQNYIPKLHHDWNELTDFIQNLRDRKQRFLRSQIEALNGEAQAAEEELATLQQQERSEIGSLVESPEFVKALEMRSDLQESLKRLGSLEQDQQDLKNLRSDIEGIEASLEETRQTIEKESAALQERVSVFNKYFSRLSKLLYGEEYLLYFQENAKGSLSFGLTSVGSNVGAGKKASQTAAFDLAYINFLTDTRINFPKFVCHDGLENIHGNQLSALLTEADQIDGQLVLATLRDKLPQMPGDFLKRNTVLELGHDDKLFGL